MICYKKHPSRLSPLAVVSVSFGLAITALLGGDLLASDSEIFFDDHIDYVMYQDPAFAEATTTAVFAEELKPLWLEALAHPQSELQRMAAETIVHAHSSGMKGLEDTVDELLVTLRQESLDPTVRRAVINALVTIDAKATAEELAAHVDTENIAIAQLIEPALARWGYEPASEMWKTRLRDEEEEFAKIQLAIRCTAIAKDSDSLPLLVDIVKDVNAIYSLRLAAARAAAQIDSGANLVAAAQSLAGVDSHAALLAASLLRYSSDADAIEVLRQLVRDKSTTVTHVALQALFENDPELVYEFTDRALDSSDVNVRRLMCEALVHKSDADAIIKLGTRLSDINPHLCRYVTRSLLKLAENPDLKPAVIDVAADAISEDSWRGIEQGLILIGALDHEPSAPRLLELLNHKRPEVSVAACWGLRKLAVDETLAPMLKHAELQTQVIADNSYERKYHSVIDEQLCQLFQAFGELGYGDAEPLMRRYIPKQPLLYESSTRPAAVWAIGKLNEGSVDEELAAQLAKRIADMNPLEPEIDPVRRMSALAIGRMGAKSQLPVLKRFLVEAPSPVGLACAWSIERMTGEAHEFELDGEVPVGGWFLMPGIKRRASGKE